MSDAIAAKGMQLQRSVDGGSNYVTVAELVDIGIDFNADEIDVTNHGSGAFREKIISFLDLGVQFDINFVPTNAQHRYSDGMINDFVTRTKRYFKILDPLGGTIVTFQAFIKQHSIKGPATDKLSASITLSNNGTPTVGS